MTTPHGRRAESVPPVRSFSSDGIESQDVGLDGVSSGEEQELFADYISSLRTVIDPDAWTMGGVTLPGSPLEDPPGMTTTSTSESGGIVLRQAYWRGISTSMVRKETRSQGSSKGVRRRGPTFRTLRISMEMEY